jgi:hypothetical protein
MKTVSMWLAKQMTVNARITPVLPHITTGRTHDGLLFQKPDRAENICNLLTGGGFQNYLSVQVWQMHGTGYPTEMHGKIRMLWV